MSHPTTVAQQPPQPALQALLPEASFQEMVLSVCSMSEISLQCILNAKEFCSPICLCIRLPAYCTHKNTYALVLDSSSASSFPLLGTHSPAASQKTRIERSKPKHLFHMDAQPCYLSTSCLCTSRPAVCRCTLLRIMGVN